MRGEVSHNHFDLWDLLRELVSSLPYSPRQSDHLWDLRDDICLTLCEIRGGEIRLSRSDHVEYLATAGGPISDEGFEPWMIRLMRASQELVVMMRASVIANGTLI